MDAYLDIETSYRKEITVLGIHRDDKGLHQLVGDKITPHRILSILDGVETIYTYNGKRFDIPVIARNTGLDLASQFNIHDLMYDCWRKRLYGGLKWVEKVLGIRRMLAGMDGHDAMELWEEYFWFKNKDALQRLLKYNEEDVVNLKTLREKLARYK